MTTAYNLPEIHLVAVPKAEWEQLRKEMKEIRNSLLSSGLEVLDNTDLKKLLKVSERTLATWREEGILPYSKVGGKIYYDPKEIQDVLSRNRVR